MCYEYIDLWNRFNGKLLLLIKKFYSKLKNKGIYHMSFITDGLYCNHFLVLDLNLLKIYQWLHQSSSWAMYDVEDDFDYTLVNDIDYPVNLQPLYKDLPFLPENREIKKRN